MSSACYIGRGLLSVSLVGLGEGFFPLSGESEVSLVFEEDNESILDARNGVVEKADWYVRNYRARLEAQCFRVNKDALALLLKAGYSETDDEVGEWELPASVTLDREYFLAPNLDADTVEVKDSLEATVDTDDYVLDPIYGTIKFVDVSAYTEPITVTGTSQSYQNFALHGTDQVFVEALFKGVNAQSGEKVLAHFYRLAVDLASAFSFIKQGFSDLPIRLQACPDFSQEVDELLGQYGRIVLVSA